MSFEFTGERADEARDATLSYMKDLLDVFETATTNIRHEIEQGPRHLPCILANLVVQGGLIDEWNAMVAAKLGPEMYSTAVEQASEMYIEARACAFNRMTIEERLTLLQRLIATAQIQSARRNN